jgi:hypothetical protein
MHREYHCSGERNHSVFPRRILESRTTKLPNFKESICHFSWIWSRLYLILKQVIEWVIIGSAFVREWWIQFSAQMHRRLMLHLFGTPYAWEERRGLSASNTPRKQTFTSFLCPSLAKPFCHDNVPHIRFPQSVSLPGSPPNHSMYPDAIYLQMIVSYPECEAIECVFSHFWLTFSGGTSNSALPVHSIYGVKKVPSPPGCFMIQ